ncbi:MAG: hypothetical protein AAF990_02405 [Bacteroidota bacterium]
MPKQQTDYLIQLIKSLSKAEKRYFRLFVTRNQASDDILFLQLFDLIDKIKRYDEQLILQRIPGIKKRQLSNLKAHLYKQLLLCLRLMNRTNNLDIELRERLDYARVLYNKGLYRQSLEILDKTKSKAAQNKQHHLVLETIEFEKLIESQYITRSIESRADQLTSEALQTSRMISRIHEFSNLSLRLYGLYIKGGFVRNKKEYLFIKEFFNANLPKYKIQDLDFYEKVYLCQAFCWYYHMTQDFLLYYRYAQKWKELFDEEPQMIRLELALYLKSLHNILTALFMLWQHDKFSTVLQELEKVCENPIIRQEKNLESLSFLFTYIHKINKHYMEGTFTEGLQLVPKLIEEIENETYNWDDRRIMVFYYKIACLYFGSGDNENAIHYLNLIINRGYIGMSQDIQCFARILCLIAHFELGNDLLVEYQVRSVYRFLSKMEDLHMVQNEILKFIRKLPRIQRSDLKKEFIRLRNNLARIRQAPFEKRPFLYLDIISWLESKIENRSVQSVMREKFQDSIGPLEDD